MTEKILTRICDVEGCECKCYARGLCRLHYQRWWKQSPPTVPLARLGIGDTAEERFWSRVNKDGPFIERLNSQCWLWTGHTTRGYGSVRMYGKQKRVHHVAYFLIYGVWPTLSLLHQCDVRACCNPEHLKEGTNAENSAEMVARNRQAQGEKAGNTKLTTEQVMEIRQRYVRYSRESGLPVLAQKYAVHPSTIGRIVRGEIWGHIFNVPIAVELK